MAPTINRSREKQSIRRPSGVADRQYSTYTGSRAAAVTAATAAIFPAIMRTAGYSRAMAAICRASCKRIQLFSHTPIMENRQVRRNRKISLK